MRCPQECSVNISGGKLRFRILVLVFFLIVCFLNSNDIAHAQIPIVRVVLFYSPSCPHCHQVITQDLPPLVENYQDQLDILTINTSTPDGQVLFQAAIDYYHVPVERQGVPMLIAGDLVLVGSYEIPNQFPVVIAEGLAQGGIDWPDIPQLSTILEEENKFQWKNQTPPKKRTCLRISIFNLKITLRKI